MILAGKDSTEIVRFGKTDEYKIAADSKTSATAVNVTADAATIEAKAKELGDKILLAQKRHCYFKVLQTTPLVCFVWAGPINIEPIKDFWKVTLE